MCSLTFKTERRMKYILRLKIGPLKEKQWEKKRVDKDKRTLFGKSGCGLILVLGVEDLVEVITQTIEKVN